jgi:hypothetical protein
MYEFEDRNADKSLVEEEAVQLESVEVRPVTEGRQVCNSQVINVKGFIIALVTFKG